jgi:hypothetical protein
MPSCANRLAAVLESRAKKTIFSVYTTKGALNVFEQFENAPHLQFSPVKKLKVACL